MVKNKRQEIFTPKHAQETGMIFKHLQTEAETELARNSMLKIQIMRQS